MNKILCLVLAAAIFTVAFATNAESIQPTIRAAYANGERLEGYSINSRVFGKSVDFSFVYDQKMNTRIPPQVYFSDSEAHGALICIDEGYWANPETFVYSCDVPTTERGFDIPAAINVVGGQSANGIRQNDFSARIRIDNIAPRVVSASASDYKINQMRQSEGRPFLVRATFSEPLASTPHVSFSDPQAATLLVFDRVEQDQSGTPTYTFFYSIGAAQYDGDISTTIFGAQDLAGNEQDPYLLERQIAIDTVPPQVSSFSIRSPYQNGINVENLNSGQTIFFDIHFSEPMELTAPRIWFPVHDDGSFERLIGQCNGSFAHASRESYHFWCQPDPRVAFDGTFTVQIEDCQDVSGNSLQDGYYLSPEYPANSISPVVRAEASYDGFDYAILTYEVPRGGLMRGAKVSSCWYVLDEGKAQEFKCAGTGREPSSRISDIDQNGEFMGAFGRVSVPVSDGTHLLEVFVKDDKGNTGRSNPVKFEVYVINHNLDSDVDILHEGSSVFILPTSPDASITVPSGISGTVLDLSKVLSGPTADIPGDITIIVNTVNGTIELFIPAGTKINGSSGWDGKISLPQLTSAFVPLASSGYTTPVAVIAIDVGSSGGLTFDKPVKIVLPLQAGKFAGFQQGSTFTEITAVCDSATAPTNPVCKIDVDGDLVIWTNHFTLFGTYTQTAIPPASVPSPPAPSNNAGGPVFFPAPTPTPAPSPPAPEQPAAPTTPSAPTPTPSPTTPANLAPVNTFEGAQPEAPTAAALNEQPSQQSDLVASLFGDNGILRGMVPILAVGGAVALAGGAVYMLAINRKKRGL